MPLQVEGRRIQMLGLAPSSNIMGSVRRARELSDIAPQYVAKSGLCTASELESSKGGSIRIQHVTGLNSGAEGKSRFPKLDECAHFHYEHVEIGPLQISLVDEDDLKPLFTEAEEEKWWSLSVTSQNKTWLIRRSYDNFRMLDQQLHRCIYDRKFSELMELRPEYIEEQENIRKLLSDYVTRFSVIAGNLINCGPVLNWLELDNRGHRLIVPDTDNCPINTPAVAAAYSVKRYTAQAPDEISFEVGDMISVIDMPPPEESIWWRGKRGFQVGFFPCECVAVIGDKVPRNLQFSAQMCQPTKPVLRKHGKLIAFFRSFILSRPSRRKLKQSGILKERVFGCDLGEHLLNSGHEIPMVLKCCVEFIETHGLIDGIYRLSGVTSNIQKLRNAFDEDRVPALYEDEAILQDVHSVASLLKMYFRELPNPLCTYQLYHQFVGAVQATQGEDTRLLKMRDVVQKLPPPHYRTLEYLMKHLARVSEKGNETGMTSRNVAIVWAPNLLRCKELEVGSVAALQGVGVQAVVTEFLVCYADLIFCDRLPCFSLPPQQVNAKKCRPKSLAISTPTKLLSLEEARTRALLQAAGKTEQEYIEVGGGPANLPAKYHTVIELPGNSRKRLGSKRSPIGWKILFGKSGRGSQSRKETESKTASSDFAFRPSKAVTELDLAQTRRRLRPAKSVESLSSTRNSALLDFSEPLKGGLSNLDELPPLSVLRNGEGKSNGHNRSVSHESYFDHLQDTKIVIDQVNLEDAALDISEIQVNFELEESEMRIFSEDETLLSAGSGSLTSNTNSPRILPNRKLGKSTVGCVNKRLSCPKLAAAEDVLSVSQSADPSPKKQKTYDGVPPRSALEEQLSNSMGDIQFIDCVSTDQISVQAEVHPIQSPSPVSSISQLSSSLLPPSSPILPHIPHLRRPLSDTSTSQNVVDNGCEHKFSSSVSALSGKSHPHSMVSKEMSPQSYLTSPSLVEAIISDNESFSLQSSELTTPDTPICRPYTPLVDCEESSVSNLTTPDFEVNVKTVKSSSSETENLDKTMIKVNLEFDEGKDIVEEFTKFEENITSDTGVGSRDVYEHLTTDMVKISKITSEESVPPKPEERKPRPVHPYVNIPFPRPKAGPRKVLETSFDLKDEPERTENQCSGSSVRYECISTESSCDSLSNMNKNYENFLPDLKFMDSSPVVESESPESPVRTAEEPSFPFSSSEVSHETFNEENTESGLLTQDEIIFCTVNDSTVAESPVSIPMSCSQDESRPCIKWMETNIDEDCASPSRDVSLEEKFKEDDVTVVEVTPHGTVEDDNEDGLPVALKETESCEKREDEVEIEESEGDLVEREKVEDFSKKFPESDCPVQKSQPKKMLETNLDELCDFGMGSDEVDEKSPSKTIIFPQKSNSSGNVRHLMSRFEISPTTEKSFAEIRSDYGNKIREEKSSKKIHANERKPLTNPVEGGIEERPKTLERLPSKRRETDKYFSNPSEVQLGKSKSGSHIDEKKFDNNNRIDVLLNCDFDLSDPKRRERIEKYKEKRRNYLREKYRSDSFRTGEKDEFVCKMKQRSSRQSEDEDGRRGREKCERSSSSSESIERSRLCGGNNGRSRKASLKGNGLSQFSNPCQGSDGDSPTDSCDSFRLGHDRKSPTESGPSFLESMPGNDRTSPESFLPHSTRRHGEKSDESHSSLSPTGDIVESQGSPTSLCIKAKAAFFEKRDDSNTPKQYLSSV